AVFPTAGEVVPPRLLHHLQRTKVLNECLVLLTVETRDEPWVAESNRLEVSCAAPGIYRVVLRYGFMQGPDVPAALRQARTLGLDLDPVTITYYVGRDTLIPSGAVRDISRWRAHLFAFLSRNATRATAFYRLPPEDVVELGFEVEI
ncbi:MAG TPA: KUP/HAK/KT family potassium transporter, partial [Steroidobacteraceae bacterium]|nr:KUP/HAK/KT family potassium transporter [Steroidobacteraceae bacterium]